MVVMKIEDDYNGRYGWELCLSWKICNCMGSSMVMVLRVIVQCIKKNIDITYTTVLNYKWKWFQNGSDMDKSITWLPHAYLSSALGTTDFAIPSRKGLPFDPPWYCAHLWAFLLQPALSSEVAQETREVGQSVQSVLGSGFETPRTRTTGRLHSIHSVHCQGSRSNTKSCCSSSHWTPSIRWKSSRSLKWPLEKKATRPCGSLCQMKHLHSAVTNNQWSNFSRGKPIAQ